MKWFFPKMFFGIDGDLNLGGGDSQEQPPAEEGNAAAPEAESAETSPTDFIEFEGVKVPSDVFEKHAREKYKDAFEAKENRDKWQAENTRKAQENAALAREAEEYRRFKQDPRYQELMQPKQPANSYESKKQQYVASKVKQFPEVDPRFFESNFDDLNEMTQRGTQEALAPFQKQQAETWEAEYLAKHPLIQKGSEQYQKIAQMVGKGYDPEDAYNIVFRNVLMEQEFNEREKRKNEENKKKLQATGTTSGRNSSKPASDDDAFERNYNKWSK